MLEEFEPPFFAIFANPLRPLRLTAFARPQGSATSLNYNTAHASRL
jgi:hypothetical protein